MVTGPDGCMQIIEHLSEHLSLFDNSTAQASETVMSAI